MLEEKAALRGVRSRSVLEVLRDRSVRWQLLTVLVSFTTLQLCGINAVSQPPRTGDKRRTEAALLRAPEDE